MTYETDCDDYAVGSEQLDRARGDWEQFYDYLVTFRVKQRREGYEHEDEITLRVSGVSLWAAIGGAESALKQVCTEVEPIKARNDHTDEDIEPPFTEYEEPLK